MVSAVHVTSKGVQSYTTPMEFVVLCENRFGVSFVLDAAADAENARCTHYYTEAVNALIQDWKGGVEVALLQGNPAGTPAVWLNCPFRQAGAFHKKCAEEAAKGTRIVSLHLASLGTKWFKEYVKPHALTLILEDRMIFEGQADPYPKELAVSIFGFGMTGIGFWAWRNQWAGPIGNEKVRIENDA